MNVRVVSMVDEFRNINKGMIFLGNNFYGVDLMAESLRGIEMRRCIME